MSVGVSERDHFCIFEVGQALFAVSAIQIREIATTPDYSSVPSSCPIVAGLWHEGSEFLPVLRLPLDADHRPRKESQVLIVQGPHGHWALLADHVFTIAKMEYSPNVDSSETDWSSVTMGMSTWEDRSVRVLHLDQVYRLLEQTLSDAWSSVVQSQITRSSGQPMGVIA